MHVLPGTLDELVEHLAEVVGGCPIRVEPLGRQQLAPRPLVRLTGLEETHQSPIDVADAHDVRIGR